MTYTEVWRRVPESNRCTRICNPLRHHSANSPSALKCHGARSVYTRRQSSARGHDVPGAGALQLPTSWCGELIHLPALALALAMTIGA